MSTRNKHSTRGNVRQCTSLWSQPLFNPPNKPLLLKLHKVNRGHPPKVWRQMYSSSMLELCQLGDPMMLDTLESSKQPGSWNTTLRSPRSGTWQLYSLSVFVPYATPYSMFWLDGTLLWQAPARTQVSRNQGFEKKKILPSLKAIALKVCSLPFSLLCILWKVALKLDLGFLQSYTKTGFRLLITRGNSSHAVHTKIYPMIYPHFFHRCSKNPRRKNLKNWSG